jgi:predicted ATPase
LTPKIPRRRSFSFIFENMIRRIEESLTEEGKSVEFSEDFSVYSADGEFSQSAGHSNDSSSGARSSLRSGSLRSGSYTQSTGSSGRRRARNAPLQARTSNPKSKSAASIVRELNELKFSSLDLYGRDEELEILHAAYRRLGKDTKSDNNSSDTCHSLKKDPMNMVILEGLSGTGKSSLVKEFRRQLAKTSATTSAIFASGKFDQLHQQRAAKPYSAFTVAFEQLCGQYSARYASPEDNPLRDAMKRDYKILIDLIPNLVTELNLDENDNKMSDTVSKDSSMLYDSKEFDIVKSQRRFQYAVRTFLRTTCKPEHPTILFLDDMQWSDQPSLDLLEYILSEPVLQETILVIGSYRSNEVDQNHPLSRMIKTLEKDRERSLERIRLSNLSLKDVNQFIADLFNSSLEETRPLAEIAQKKVQGNAFFLIQFLTALRDGGYLEYNIGTMKWTWELNSIRKSIVVASNVLTYLMQRMKYLPDTLRRILLIVSCLGSSFDEQVVNVLANGLADSEILPLASDEAAQDLLRQLQIEGLLESFQAQDGRSSYCFAHDQIELAAQSLQDDDTIHVLKLQMARILYDSRDQLDFSGNLFLIVDLWNESREEVIEPGDDRKLIDLNQLAGSKALDLSAFDAAIHYFRSAIALIPMDCQWKDENYSRTLELYNSLIKAEFSAGSWEHLSNDINTILKQSERPILDKIVAYTVRIAVLSSHENKHEEAIALAVEVLEKLGIKFRPGLGKLAIIGGLIKTKQLLKKIPLDSLLSQIPMDNKNKEVGMDILTSVTSSLYAANPDLYMTGILKILRWSLKYGTTKHTSRCIGLYGLVEMALGNLEGGTSACKLAVQLAEEQDLMKSEYAPITSVYGFVFPWTHPLQNCQKKLYDGYNVGLQTGDMEYAMMNIALFGFFCYSNGKPLSDLEADMRDYAEQMEECNMMLQLKFLSLTWQTILNLLGRSDDPLTLTGEAMNQEEILEDAETENNPPLKAQLYCHQLQLAVYFGDFDLASSLIRHTSCISAVNPGTTTIWLVEEILVLLHFSH